MRVEATKQRSFQGVAVNSLPSDRDEPDPTYRSVLDWVWSFSARPRTPDEVIAQRAVKLDRMRALLRRLDDPQHAFPSLLVAGTKGKGSTVAMLAASLQAAGRRTGRYTSPHLINWRERTCLGGEPISTESVIQLAEPIRRAVAALPAALGEPTTFEVGTAFALLYFARAQVDVAVLEVGVGGRYDATNVVEPLVSAITPISYDHTPTLGSSLEAIAHHKAGVLRPGRPGVVAPQPEPARLVIEREARALGARLVQVGRDWWWTAEPDGGDVARAPISIQTTRPGVSPLRVRVGLLGDHQRDNAAAAAAALYELGQLRPELAVSPAAIQAGLGQVDWPGRLQVLQRSPLLIVDGAHNAASAEVVRQAVQASFRFRRLSLVIGLSAGKDARGVLGALVPWADSLRLTRAQHERAADPAELLQLARELAPDRPIVVEPDLPTALAAALDAAEADDLVLVTGSLFLVGEALLWWRCRSPR